MNAHFLRKLWDVSRPNFSVDNSRAVVYNINVIKRKEIKNDY